MKLKLRASVFLLLAFLLTGCGARGAKVKAEEVQETFFAVSVIPAISGQIQDYLDTNGEVISKVSVDVFPDNSGKITRFLKGLGQSVVVGEVIGYVDPSRPGSKFALSPIRAPISGTITSLPVKAGATVNMQSHVAKISRLDQLEIVTYVAERFFSKVKLGAKALIKFDAYPGLTFEARVFEVAPFIDSSKRTLELKLNIVKVEQSQMIEMGMFAEVRLIVEEKPEVVKISSSSVVRRNGIPYVFVVKDEKPRQAQEELEEVGVDLAMEKSSNTSTDFVKHWVEQREIKEGIAIDGQVEILSGLEAGDLVVIRGQNSLGDGSGIRIIEEARSVRVQGSLEVGTEE